MPPPRKTSTSANIRPQFRSLYSLRGTNKSTPLRAKLQGSLPASSNHKFMHAKDVYDHLSNEMRDQFLGPMPIREFLEKYLACDEVMEFEDILIPLTAMDFLPNFREQVEQKICDAINGSGVCRNLYFVDTHKKVLRLAETIAQGEGADQKIDISGVLRGSELPEDIVPSFTNLGVAMEMKPELDDIVVDPTGTTAEERAQEGFEHQVDKAVRARGQISSYALHQFQHQECTHVISVVLFENEARLLRFDHSGVVVSERFDYTKGSIFTEFLWRLDRALGKGLGVDTSVAPVLEADSAVVKAARDAFEAEKDFLPYPVTPTMELRKVSVCDESAVADADVVPPSRELIAAPAQHHSLSPIGRYTLSYPAYDPETKLVVWIKEAWRIDEEGFQKEGDIYARLAKLDMKGKIPEILCHGDVRDRDGEIQVTRTQDCKGEPWAALSDNIHRYVHYRIVFKTIGLPLTTFSSTKQLVQVLSDALVAHGRAYKFGRILHRDISQNNVLIGRDGRGLLIDWDMSKDLDIPGPRIPWRTGTWQFISAELLRKPLEKTHALRDDLESFLWLLLYIILRYHYRLPNLVDRSGTSANVGGAPPPPTDVIIDDDDDEEADTFALPEPPRPRSEQRPAPRLTYMDWPTLQTYVHYLFDNAKVEDEEITLGGERKVNFFFYAPDHPDDDQIACAVDDAARRIPPPLAKLIGRLRVLFQPLYKLQDPTEYEETYLSSAYHVALYFKEALQSQGWHANDAAETDHFQFENSTRQTSSRASKPKQVTDKSGTSVSGQKRKLSVVQEDEVQEGEVLEDEQEPEALRKRSRRSSRADFVRKPPTNHSTTAPQPLDTNGRER
ncbi:hypothetical protein PENSPDRAFT_683725 [Peniophora sp. CONT]|nr:hypothetical protein PENSPDRAFT_683725 [Peniophora sp. CONT]